MPDLSRSLPRILEDAYLFGGNSTNVTNFLNPLNEGADAASAIQAAIDTVAANGGGEVFFPSGTYTVDAPIQLKSLEGSKHRFNGDIYDNAANRANKTGIRSDPYERSRLVLEDEAAERAAEILRRRGKLK